MPIFCQKTSNLTKTLCSHIIFFEFSMKNPLLPCPYLVEKSKFCQNYTILWQKKVNRMPFSSDFSRKNYCPNAHVVSKRRPFSKKHIALMPIFCQKNVSSFKNTVLPYYFFQIFHKKPYAVMPKSAQKNVNSVKITLFS